MIDISDSVGERTARNLNSDVVLVHGLINNVPEQDGGVSDPIPLNPYGWEQRTPVAIKKFQWRQFPVDPHTEEYGQVNSLRSASRRTLQRLNEFAPPRTAASHAAPNAVRGVEGSQNPPLLFVDMWNLTYEQVNAFPWDQLHSVRGYSSGRGSSARSFVSPELLVSIFWEETAFRNIQGQLMDRGGRRRNEGMWGFGQVDHRNIEGFNDRYGSIGIHFEDNWGFFSGQNFSRSIDLEIVALVEEWRMTGNERSALNCLGNPLKVTGWLNCKNILQRLQLGYRLTTIDDSVGVNIREALWESRPHVFNPDLAFPP